MVLDDKAAVITGAGSGTGRATAHLFAERGARVAVVDIGSEEASMVTGTVLEVDGGRDT